MSWPEFAGYAGLILVTAFQIYFLGRAILRPHREPSARIAWVLVLLPAIGVLLYVLFGETNVGVSHARRYRRIMRRMRAMYPVEPGDPRLDRPRPEHRHLFRLAHSINGFVPVSGHKAELLADADSMIERLVADIDAARETVHLLFYIWLADATGLKVAEAAMRAARRGVNVRVLADDLGSRRVIRSPHWQGLGEPGSMPHAPCRSATPFCIRSSAGSTCATIAS